MEGRSAGTWLSPRINKVEGSKEADRRIKNREDVGPANIRNRIWDSNRIEGDTTIEIDNAVGRSREAVP
jgi:hypothetical protein